MNRMQDIMMQIRKLEAELASELHKKETEFLYRIRGAKIVFDSATRLRQKGQARHLFRFVLNASALNILTAPIIWFCLVPALFLDVVVSGYQSICFRVYGIPRVKRADYMIIDHQFLGYLNTVERINCMYCSYVNGLLAYVQEIAGRTEQYWCPIKHARRLRTMHSRYYRFMDYGDADTYRRDVEFVRRDFRDISDPPAGQENKTGQPSETRKIPPPG